MQNFQEWTESYMYMVLKAVFSPINVDVLYTEDSIITCDDLTPVGVDFLNTLY